MFKGLVIGAIAIGGIVGIIIVGIVILWGIIGGMYRKPNSKGQNHPSPGGGGGSNCNHCKEVRSYYNGLHWLVKMLKAAWYLFKMADCAIKGC
ncbi:hypothetical protein IMCC3317_21410 [Kordia antarctica]|uniref:Uncharacterized protein n=1 Tax=Kordia antarctica TaxID=1218801 RepID=A0A7L4ZJT5_9FLAO|nr:hypothetical protein [Kordia antarctica]QHI36771.1 hypothetical protein IMCC3317_21410 [Kordia antarctica]